LTGYVTTDTLLGAVSQDFMCEPLILQRTGLTVQDHQKLTIERYVRLMELTDVYILPVLQGFSPESYAEHVRGYGALLKQGHWVGVGSVCKRNDHPRQIEDVLLAIKSERPDLRLHGFGIKLTALSSVTVRSLLHSADSMAWSYAGRRKRDGSLARNISTWRSASTAWPGCSMPQTDWLRPSRFSAVR
jgi:hypothetical protein